MAEKIIRQHINTGTAANPEYVTLFAETLAQAVYMDTSHSKTIKDYVDESISSLVDGAPDALDTLKELGDAIKAGDNDIIEALQTSTRYTNTDPIINAIGGIKAGENFNNMSITEMFTKLLYPYAAPLVANAKSINASGVESNGGIYECGESVSIKSIKADITKKSYSISKVEVTFNNTSIKTIDDISTLDNNLVISSGTYKSSGLSMSLDTAVTINKTSAKNFTVKVTDSSTELSRTATTSTTAFHFVYPYYYGCVNNTDFTESVIKGLIKVKAVRPASYTLTFNPSNQFQVFAFPAINESGNADKKLTLIEDAAHNKYTSAWNVKEMNIAALDGTSQKYYIYYSGIASTAKDFVLTFKY